MRDFAELELKLHSSNDAFGDDSITAAREVSRILREVADDVEIGTSFCGGNLRDANGNCVGSFEFVVTPDDGDQS